MTTLHKRKLWNHHWLFLLDDHPEFSRSDYPDSHWRSLHLPHDWSNELPIQENSPSGSGGGYAQTGIGWYRKHFSYLPQMEEEHVSLLFDGVYMDCQIYLNGNLIASNGYGYNSFFVDLTGHLLPGENVIAIRVDNSHQPNSRWYSGSGIYRNVWLEITDPVHMSNWGVFCTVSEYYPEQNMCALQIDADITNETGKMVHAGVLHHLYDADGVEVSKSGTALSLQPGSHGRTLVRPILKNPHLWSDENPYLYTLESTVLKEGIPVDTVIRKIGLRTAVFDCDKGFLLNGNPVKIKGVCVHHDCGLTGGVGYRETWERRLRALKEMGCNGIRCAHNPPTPELLDLCDELGFLVMDEAFDEWRLTKDKINNYYSEQFAYGSSQYFDQHAEEILRSMIHRDRNHPSVILWSIGNEIPEQATADGPAIARWLQEICHQEDHTRMVTSACDNIVAPAPSTARREFEEVLDVVGYNYVNRWRERAETQYDEDRHLYPKRRFLGSENASAGGCRGRYKIPSNEKGRFYGDYRTLTHQHE